MTNGEETLRTIDQRMKRVGDLPIFSASVNRIRKISTDPESTALALTKEVEQDANLTAKILSLANSSYYNSGKGKFGTVSRAIILLGFNTIGNICLTLKLIESLQREQPSIDMGRMMVNAYLSAVFVREIAMRSGVKDIEEAYTCALLHNIGEILIGYFLPEKFLQMRELQRIDGQDRHKIQQEVLGITFEEVGQHLAKSWELPSGIVNTIQRFDPDTAQAGLKGIMLNRALASLGNTIVHTLHSGQGHSTHNLSELIHKMADTAGLDQSLVQDDLVESFKKSCTLASNYGIKRDVLTPNLTQSGDEFRDRLAGKLSYLASNYQTRTAESGSANSESPETSIENEPRQASHHAPKEKPAPARNRDSVSTPSASTEEKRVDTGIQLEIVQEITMLLTSGAKPNDVLLKVLDGMHRGANFDRVALMLTSPDRASYSVRLSAGKDTQRLRDCLQNPIQPDSDLFSKILLLGSELCVDNCSDSSWRELLPEDFAERIGTRAFILGALRNGNKPIGLFYADNFAAQSPISEVQRRGFQQFLTQARLAIQVSNSGRS